MLEELNAIMCHSAEMVTCLWHPTVTLETHAIVSADHFGFRWTGENIKTNEILEASSSCTRTFSLSTRCRLVGYIRIANSLQSWLRRLRYPPALPPRALHATFHPLTPTLHMFSNLGRSMEPVLWGEHAA